jgi:methionyl-tRNA formyltransferase
MRIMIIGQKWLALEAFKLAWRLGHDVTAVATPSEDDRLYQLATERGVPALVVPERLTVADIPGPTELLLCAHAWCFITQEAREATYYGALGYHPSLLPKHRGRDAIRWAIHMGEKVTGGTAYWMTDQADAGAIAAQDWCHIRPDDDPITLWRRELGPMGLRLFERVLNDLSEGRKVAIRQDEALATWEPAFSRGKLGG